MSEEWKEEFFEWKDEIESKYNEISESRIKYENKIEALEKKTEEVEGTIMLNTCRKITEPYCPMRIADLDQIKEHKEQIAELKAIEKISLDTIKVINKDYKDIKKVLRDFLWALDDYFESKNKKKFQKIFRKLHKNLDSKTEKKDLVSQCCACQKSIDDQNAVYFSNRNWICDKCINIVCSEWFEDYLEWKEEKRGSGGEKTEPENDEPWECPICHKTVYIGYTVHRHCLDKLIEVFLEKLEFLRDKVLEAPIISGSVQDLRDHIHDIKDLVIKTIKEYEGG